LSYTGVSTWPEIIEPCYDELKRVCGEGTAYNGCVLIVGVVGISGTSLNSFRLKGFYGHNKLKINMPTNITTHQVKFPDHIMDYYWFIINDTVAD